MNIEIENELKKFSITDAAISELGKYMCLKINGLEDKEGQKIVGEARKVVKRHRIDVDKLRKELTTDALEYQRKINAEAKRITGLLEPIENHLELEEKKVSDEIERIKREKEQAESKKLQERIHALLSLDFKFDGIQYFSDYLEPLKATISNLKGWDEETFNKFLADAKDNYEVNDKLKLEEIRLENERRAKDEADRKTIAEERARLDAIAKAQNKKEAALKAEADRIEAEKQSITQAQSEQDAKIIGAGIVAAIANGVVKVDLVKSQIPEPEFAEVETEFSDIEKTSDYELGYRDGFLSSLKTVYELAKNLPREQLLETLQEEINERK